MGKFEKITALNYFDSGKKKKRSIGNPGLINARGDSLRLGSTFLDEPVSTGLPVFHLILIHYI